MRVDEILTWQHIRSGKHRAFAENIPPRQTADIAERRLQSVATAREQEQIKHTIEYANNIAEAAQGDLTQVLINAQVPSRAQPQQLVSKLSRSAAVDLIE